MSAGHEPGASAGMQEGGFSGHPVAELYRARDPAHRPEADGAWLAGLYRRVHVWRVGPVPEAGFDLAVSSLVLLLTAPLILGGMLAIRWEGPGPVLYLQDRVTKDGRIFAIMKLRTM